MKNLDRGNPFLAEILTLSLPNTKQEGIAKDVLRVKLGYFNKYGKYASVVDGVSAQSGIKHMDTHWTAIIPKWRCEGLPIAN